MAGRVYVGDTDVNAELIKGGHAWVYRQYVTDPSLFALEEQAKANGRGLWGLPEAQVQPWEWRRGRRQPVGKVVTTHGNVTRCGTKRYCREMASCEEALHYLKNCGLKQLDGDSDGVPCEKICR